MPASIPTSPLNPANQDQLPFCSVHPCHHNPTPQSNPIPSYAQAETFLKNIIRDEYTLININQDQDHSKIKCPNVTSIDDTQAFLTQAQHVISSPGPLQVVLVNDKQQIGFIVKQTKWSDMTPQEIEELNFVTSTIFEYGNFFKDQKNGSMIGGTRKAIGWHAGYDDLESFGQYIQVLCFFSMHIH